MSIARLGDGFLADDGRVDDDAGGAGFGRASWEQGDQEDHPQEVAHSALYIYNESLCLDGVAYDA